MPLWISCSRFQSLQEYSFLPPSPVGGLTLVLSTSNCLSCNSKISTFEAPTGYTLPLVPCTLVKLLGQCKLSATRFHSRGGTNARAPYGENRLSVIASKSKFRWAQGRAKMGTCLYTLTPRISYSFQLLPCKLTDLLQY